MSISEVASRTSETVLFTPEELTKEHKLFVLCVFWANYCKQHPIWSKLGAFLSKMVYWVTGWEIGQTLGIQKVKFSRSGRHIYLRFGSK